MTSALASDIEKYGRFRRTTCEALSLCWGVVGASAAAVWMALKMALPAGQAELRFGSLIISLPVVAIIAAVGWVHQWVLIVAHRRLGQRLRAQIRTFSKAERAAWMRAVAGQKNSLLGTLLATEPRRDVRQHPGR